MFDVPELAVDFFFMISGFFLMRSMRKLKDERVFPGLVKILFSRVKPMLFTILFITTFDLICILLFIKGDYFYTFYELFKYWWFVAYLLIAIGIFYLVYRLLKKEKFFVIFLAVVALGMGCLHYCVVELEMFHWMFVFTTRAFSCVSVGVLVSYIPKMQIKKFNISIPIVVVLAPTLIYLFLNDKTFFTCVAMIAMFGALIYFSTHIPVGGKVFDLIGKLSVRMYLYMAFLTMLFILGLTHHRVLFVIDIALAVLDLLISYYHDKYKALKKEQQKEKQMSLSAT